MSRTIRKNASHKNQSKESSQLHRYDGHKLATGVNHAYEQRHQSLVNLQRSGNRGK